MLISWKSNVTKASVGSIFRNHWGDNKTYYFGTNMKLCTNHNRIVNWIRKTTLLCFPSTRHRKNKDTI